MTPRSSSWKSHMCLMVETCKTSTVIQEAERKALWCWSCGAVCNRSSAGASSAVPLLPPSGPQWDRRTGSTAVWASATDSSLASGEFSVQKQVLKKDKYSQSFPFISIVFCWETKQSLLSMKMKMSPKLRLMVFINNFWESTIVDNQSINHRHYQIMRNNWLINNY